MAGVVHENVVERRAFDGKRRDADAGVARGVEHNDRGGDQAVFDEEKPEDGRLGLDLGRFRQRAQLIEPAGRHAAEKLTSGTFFPGIDAFNFNGESSATSLP